MVNFFGNSSNIYGSYFFPSSDAPQYYMGGIILSSFAAGGIALATSLGIWLRELNKKAFKEEQEDGQRRYKYLW